MSDANEDLKAKMREALEKKKASSSAGAAGADGKEKAHGPEVVGATRKMHRRKSG